MSNRLTIATQISLIVLSIFSSSSSMAKTNAEMIQETFIDQYSKCSAYFLTVGAQYKKDKNIEMSKKMTEIATKFLYWGITLATAGSGRPRDKVKKVARGRLNKYVKAMSIIRRAKANGMNILHVKFGKLCLDAHEDDKVLYNKAMGIVKEKGDWK